MLPAFFRKFPLDGAAVHGKPLGDFASRTAAKIHKLSNWRYAAAW